MDPTESNSGPAGASSAAAASVSPDPITASLLEKHAAGIKLTSSEYGKMGAFARWLKKPFGTGRAGTGPAQPGNAPGNKINLASLAPGQTQDPGLAPVEVDAGLCQRTTAAVLNRADAAAVGYVERAAKAAVAGLDPAAQDKMLDRFRTAAALPVADKKLVVEISPDVFQELGWDPRKFAIWTAVGVLGLHSVNLWQCVSELKEMKKPEAKNPTSAEQPQAVPIKPGSVPIPEKAPAPALEPDGQTIVKFPK